MLSLKHLTLNTSSECLIQVFQQVRRSHSIPHRLLVVGGNGSDVPDNGEGVTFLPYQSREELSALYRNATLFLFASQEEGFGMPPLEAMACGTPVIVSNLSSLPEVLGDPWTGKCAGLTVPPTDVDALASAIGRVLTDEALRERLRREGLARAREFSWERSAGEIRQLLGG